MRFAKRVTINGICMRTSSAHTHSYTIDMNEADWQGFPAITHVIREARDICPRHYTPLVNEAFITLRGKRDRSGNNIQCTGLEVQASK